MTNTRHYFSALLTKINPSENRLQLAKELPGQVREWLKGHSFKTSFPHTRLCGSYARSTTILDIKDIDVLLFLPDSQLDRTPNAVLREVKKVLEEYPDTTIEVSPQKRSVHLEFTNHEVYLDIVPAVASDGIDKPLKVPDRASAEWIDSDPLGYVSRMSAFNQEHGGKVVPFVKLIKAWRGEQIKLRNPKSYVVEVMAFYAVEDGAVILKDNGYDKIVTAFFQHIAKKYEKLMDEGKESPRVHDPQIPTKYITRGWERSHFETFMRRIREAEKAAQRALAATDEGVAQAEWKKVFGDLWPSDTEAKQAAESEARNIASGITTVSSSGRVVGVPSGLVSPRTTYHH